MKGITGENLLQLLERRLDNVAYRLGFASSRNEARQLVRHGHVVVNGRKVNVPSYLTRTGDVVEVREGSRKFARVQAALESVVRRGVPSWLDLERDAFRGKVRELPKRDDLSTPEIHERLVVELYSK
jgi:small subunit ribosomal protein S4